MSADILLQLEEIVGSGRLTTADAVGEFEFPWATHGSCQAKAIVYPQTTDEVAEIMRVCNAAQQTVVPFGGATNLVQGCATTPDDIALSLQKMNRLEGIDATGRTLTAQAGVTMQDAQKAADDADLFFPVDTGARGNCQLGGIVATNAGGSKVIRYGMTRESVLGLEAVLADGTVVTSMNRYLKNNSGFDLKQLFIGSEGVLGIITRVVFRLGTKATTHNVALIACEKFADVVGVLRCANTVIPNTMTAFEVMWNEFYELAVQPRGRLVAPVDPGANYYVIVESMGVDEEHDAQVFETLLEMLAEQELLIDGTLAKSGKEIESIWRIRDEVEPVIDGALNFDVSLKSEDIGGYVAEIDAAIHKRFTDANVIGFGHLGDNNVHISVAVPNVDEKKAHDVEEFVYGRLAAYDGAVSAEHGIGLTKREWLPISRTPAEIELMLKLKSTLDPNNILNPGKVVSSAADADFGRKNSG